MKHDWQQSPASCWAVQRHVGAAYLSSSSARFQEFSSFFIFCFPLAVSEWIIDITSHSLGFFFPQLIGNRFLGSGGASTSIQKCWIWEGSEGPMTCHFLKSLGKDSVCDINQDLKASSRTRPSGSEKRPIQRMSFCGVCFCKRSGQSVSAFHKSVAGPADCSCPTFNFQSHSIYFYLIAVKFPARPFASCLGQPSVEPLILTLIPVHVHTSV